MTGACYAKTAYNALADFGDPIINFKEDLTYGCTNSMTKAELETRCKATATTQQNVKNLQIFANLDELKKVGKLGNANIFYPKDWLDVVDDPSMASLGKAAWDADLGQCTIYSSVLIKVVYYNVGYTKDPQ